MKTAHDMKVEGLIDHSKNNKFKYLNREYSQLRQISKSAGYMSSTSKKRRHGF